MKKATVLLVEDDPTVSTVLGLILERAGYGILRASHVADAVFTAKTHPDAIHLLLCDVKLRDESGSRVASEVRTRFPEVKVLYLSGFPMDVLLERGFLTRSEIANGSTWYLQKPFLPGTLVKFIEQVLSPECKTLTAGGVRRLVGVEYGAY
jgi:two-component system cell cycle sensor histidine kinase/response regulator CckA